MMGIDGFGEYPIKIRLQGGLGDELSDIGEGKMPAAFDGMTALRGVREPVGIKPCDGGCHCAKIQMVHHGIGVAGLAFAAADFLFDLFETGLYFPPCAVVFNDLLDTERQVGGKQRDPLCFAVNPHDTHFAVQCFEHHDFAESLNFAWFAVEIDRVSLGKVFETRRKGSSVAGQFPIFSATPPLTFLRLARQVKEVGIDTEPGQNIRQLADLFAHGGEQSVIAEPTENLRRLK